ncbi:hypothetical protein ACLOJK_009260 [Asimina triloba]
MEPPRGRAKLLGPLMKFAMCICATVVLCLWPIIGILGSILAGAGYGLFSPLVATFDALGEGKTKGFNHCIVDGTWSTVKGSCTAVRDFTDVCLHSYFAIMDDFRIREPLHGIPYEIRLFHLLGALFVGALGVIVDMPMITSVAFFKSPYMLFKGWHRLFHDLIGREGPFLETACVPFAGLFILLWPLVVAGAVLASVLSSFFLGAYAAAIVYQESSIRFGMNYIIASLSLFDEYSNDVLDLPEGSCFPRCSLAAISGREPVTLQQFIIQASVLPKGKTWWEGPSFTLFEECKHHGEYMVAEALITPKDIEDFKYSKHGSRVVDTGLPAYCILQTLLRSAKANSAGFLLSDNTEITTANRPQEAVFGWFFDPLIIIKEQIKAENLSEEEEDYLGKLVLLNGYPERLKTLNIGLPPQTEQKRAEVDALARRLQGITRSISRYPTFKRRVESLAGYLSEEIAKKNGSSRGSRSMKRSESALGRLFSQNSLGRRAIAQSTYQEVQVVTRNGSQIVRSESV